jgi:hypothetical protein
VSLALDFQATSEALLVKYTASVDAFSGLPQTSPILKKHSELKKIQSPKAVIVAACKQGTKPQAAQVKFDVNA